MEASAFAGCGPRHGASPTSRATRSSARRCTTGEDDGAPAAAVEASLGCGVPTAVADLHEGETVLDLGSGAGADVFLSARRVGPTGKAIGLDMTDEMLELARAHAAEAGVDNVEFVKGYIEEIPLADESVDVVISNCVINLSADKGTVLREAPACCGPGGRFAVSDVIADEDMDAATRADMQQWTGCVAGALTRGQFEAALSDAGLVDLEIRETHRVHEHAARRSCAPASRAHRASREARRIACCLASERSTPPGTASRPWPRIATTGAGPARDALLDAPFPAGMVAGFWLAGRAIERRGVRPLLIVALLLVALGLAWIHRRRLLADLLRRPFGHGPRVSRRLARRYVRHARRWPGQEYVCMSRIFAAYSIGGLIGPALGAVGGIAARSRCTWHWS